MSEHREVWRGKVAGLTGELEAQRIVHSQESHFFETPDEKERLTVESLSKDLLGGDRWTPISDVGERGAETIPKALAELSDRLKAAESIADEMDARIDESVALSEAEILERAKALGLQIMNTREES